MKQTEIRFGTGGVPLSSADRTVVSGIKRIRELGLDHLELEFVQSVYVAEKDVEKIKIQALTDNVSLTVHGSYYINLASLEIDKYQSSIDRIVAGAIRGDELGAKSITFHSAFIQKQDREIVAQKIVAGLTEVFQTLKTKMPQPITIKIAPELTGKPTQFGEISELLQTVLAFRGTESENNISLCIDFAHNHARQNGVFTTYDEYCSFFEQIEKTIGAKYLQNLHMHMSAIEFSPKGERNHLTFLESKQAYLDKGIDLAGLDDTFTQLATKKRLGGGKQDWQTLLKVLKKFAVTGYLVCESPLLEADALLLQKYYQLL